MAFRPASPLAALALLVAAVPATAAPGPSATGRLAEGVGKDLVPVANVPFVAGTDLEFATVKGRDYAIVPSQNNPDEDAGLRVVDITDPRRPRVTGFLECSVSQNDVQVRGTLVLMGVDYNAQDGACFQQVKAVEDVGLLVVSIANPARPRAIGFVPIPTGVHNATWHPGGRYVYVSDSESSELHQAPALPGGRIHVVDVANPAKPKVVGSLLTRGDSSHDISFNRSGTRAYSAALDHTLVIDTSNPAQPSVISVIVDQDVYLHHGADPTPDGRYLLVTDEQMGGRDNAACNVGGVHVYDITDERLPKRVGFYTTDPTNSLTATLDDGGNINCTAHVLDFSADGKVFTNAFYAGGVRIVATPSGPGVPAELAHFVAVDADTWSAKTYKSSRWLFANDLARGLDVFEWVPGKGVVDTRRSGSRITFRRTPTRFGAGEYCFTRPVL